VKFSYDENVKNLFMIGLIMLMSLGKRLKKEREARGWSQLFVADKLGISNTVLSNYERDYRDPDTETLRRLADLYEVSTDYLLGKPKNLAELHQRIVDRVAKKKTPYLAGKETENDVVEKLLNDPDIQFIMRAREDLSPKAYQKFMELAKKTKEMFEDEDDD
jgi:transcriptional regulator with XRE-family HTH domain